MFSKIVTWVARWISSGVGSGYAFVAPGTWGSAAALVFWWLMWRNGFVGSLQSQLALIAVTTVVGTAAVGLCVRGESSKDPQWIVIDEWAGLYVALLGLAPANIVWVTAAFCLFRLFDATKWGPVGWAERLPNEFGIMGDDLVAGALTALVIYLCRWVVGV